MKKNDLLFPLITYRTKISPIFTLIPLLIVSAFIGWLYQNITFIISLFGEIDDSSGIQVLEGTILVILAVLGGFVIVYTIKKRKIKILKIFYTAGIIVSTTALMWIHGYLIREYYFDSYIWIEITTSIIGLILGILTVLVLIMQRGNVIIKNIVVVILSLVIGTSFGLFLSPITLIVLLILLSLFDIYSVFKGPISKLFKENKINFDEITLENYVSKKEKHIDIGIGDFSFYVTLVTFAGQELSLIFAFISLAGIIIGVLLTQFLLRKYKRFPGLPIPIFLSLILLGTNYLIIEIIMN